MSVQEVDRLLYEKYGDLTARSAEHQATIDAADAYVDKGRSYVVGRPRRYVVQATPSGWDVTVLSLEELQQMLVRRNASITVHVIREGGHLRGTSIEVRN